MLLIFSLAIIFPNCVLAADLERQGKISLFASKMPGQPDQDVSSASAGTEGNLDFNLVGKNNNLNFRMQPWFKIDSLNKSNEEKNQLELLESHLNWKKDSQSLKAGLSSVNWEGTDFLNPMDIMNAKSYRDPMNMQNRSSALLNYKNQGEKWGIDLIYIPWRSQDLLPGENSSWWPRHLALPTENEDSKLLIPELVQYKINHHQILNDALRHNAGLKLQYSGDQWDFSVAASEGAASPLLLHPIANATIVVAPAKVLRLQTPIHIQPLYYRQRIMAAAFTKAWDTVIFRIASRHSQPLGDDTKVMAQSQSGLREINIRIPSWSQFTVVEIEKHFNVFENDLTLIFEYAESKKPSSSSVSSFSSALQNVYLIGFRFPLTETWTWNGAFFQDYKTKANYAHSSLAKSWNDHLSSELSLDLFSGGDESLLGVYDKNDQVSFKTSYAF